MTQFKTENYNNQMTRWLKIRIPSCSHYITEITQWLNDSNHRFADYTNGAPNTIIPQWLDDS